MNNSKSKTKKTITLAQSEYSNFVLIANKAREFYTHVVLGSLVTITASTEFLEKFGYLQS